MGVNEALPSPVVYARSQRGDPISERGTDLYETPECAVHSLMANLTDRPVDVWEACAGRGAIARVLARDYGCLVHASDVVDYGERDGDHYVFRQMDFLKCDRNDVPYGCEAIITNPPYMSGLPVKMALHGLTLVPRVIFLLRLAFLEGKSKQRCQLLDGGQLKRVYVYRDRLPRMHRDGWVGPVATSTTAFAWFEFDRYHSGPAEIFRINSTDGVF